MVTQGTIVGGFRIREPLGAGAMGEVYLAETVESGDSVAVKIIAARPSHVYPHRSCPGRALRIGR